MMPRERLVAKGPESLSDSELLAIFLRTGVQGMKVLALSEYLLDRFDGLRGLMQASAQEVMLCPGIGVAKYSEIATVLEISKRCLEQGIKRGEAIDDPGVTKQFLKLKMLSYTREVFACLFLDNQHRLICYEEMFFGTIDGASVHPREVVKRTLFHNAAAIIFAHNHPSGISEPSQADLRITERLKAALSLVDVRVLDHMVIGDAEVTSFAERGLL